MFSRALKLTAFALLMAVTPMVVAKGPAPSSPSNSTRIEARLTATAASRLASGKAKFERKGTRTKFSTEGEDLAASFNGKVATVLVNGVAVGTARVALGGFDLNLDSALRHRVPQIAVGARVSVNIGGTNVLNGRF